MTEDIIFSREGVAGRVLLNRPKVLNVLTHEMILKLQAQLNLWAPDDNVKLIIIEGVGEKAFCAGGDIRALYNSRPKNEEFCASFFADEYRLNMGIKSYPKPYISIMDGIVMGGGVGVSVPGSFRIATERTRCAMPETGIGLFPDVGATYFLSRAPHYSGIYLGLTGDRMNAADAIYTGFADKSVSYDCVPELTSLLCNHDYGPNLVEEINTLIKPYAFDPGPAALKTLGKHNLDVFSEDSVEQIITGLEALGSDWSTQTLTTLRQKSPTSLKVTLKAINRARDLTFNSCMAQEYRIVLQIMKGNDIYEGTRALIIEKDGQPEWQPTSLEYVSTSLVDRHFQSLGEMELCEV